MRGHSVTQRQEVIREQLDVARALIANFPFNARDALTMLNALPKHVDPQLQQAIHDAQQTAALVGKTSSSRIVVARFALARVVRLLEHRLTREMSRTVVKSK